MLVSSLKFFVRCFIAALMIVASINLAHAAPWIGETFEGVQCVTFFGNNPSGGTDYRLRNQSAKRMKQLKTVEDTHFKTRTENLTVSNPLPDIDYTLQRYPNHHRALNTIIQARLRKIHRKGIPPAECYLQRAVNFAPDDGTTHMLYGILLHRTGRLDDALKCYQNTERLQPNDIQTKYNMGLVFIDLERYEDALKYAQEVYSHDYPLPGLKRKLKESGYWNEEIP